MTDQQKKIAAGGSFAVLAALVLFFELHDFGSPTPAAPPVITTAAPARTSAGGGTAKRLGTTAADLDPTLHMRAMMATESLAYSGSGRNIFSANSVAAVAIPHPIAPGRTHTLTPTILPGPVGPPPPPPIELTFFGTATSETAGKRALLLRGEDVYLASAGDVVQRRYKVISIATNSLVVEDLVDNHQQTLPLQKNP